MDDDKLAAPVGEGSETEMRGDKSRGSPDTQDAVTYLSQIVEDPKYYLCDLSRVYLAQQIGIVLAALKAAEADTARLCNAADKLLIKTSGLWWILANPSERHIDDLVAAIDAARGTKP